MSLLTLNINIPSSPGRLQPGGNNDLNGHNTDPALGQTAWWITRYLADRLLELKRLEQAHG